MSLRGSSGLSQSSPQVTAVVEIAEEWQLGGTPAQKRQECRPLMAEVRPLIL